MNLASCRPNTNANTRETFWEKKKAAVSKRPVNTRVRSEGITRKELKSKARRCLPCPLCSVGAHGGHSSLNNIYNEGTNAADVSPDYS